MKRFFSMQNLPASRRLLCLAFTAGIALPLPALAASVSLATEPMATTTTSTVKPNVMFVLDNSGSMGWDFLPDWATDKHPDTSIKYIAMPELFKNAGFNGVAYNPAVNYKPPVLYSTGGATDTTTYPSVPSPWTAVRYDGFGKQSNTVPDRLNNNRDIYQFCPDGSLPAGTSRTCNLVGNASYYVFIPGEFCSTVNMTSCVPATAPTTIGTITYDKPAGTRWCNSAELTNCRSINNSIYKYPRYPKPATATVKVTASTSAKTVNQITVNGKLIMTGPATGSNTTSITATNISNAINACTTATAGSCTIAGYRATTSESTVTIYAPEGSGAITYALTISGLATTTKTPFAGGVPGSNIYTNIVTGSSYPYPGTTSKAATRTDCAGTTCTYTEEMTNYANWWTYYHTRMQAMKSSVSRAFQGIDNKFRVGFSTISETDTTDGAMFLNNNTFELTHKNTWFTKLFAQKPSGGTPLRAALAKAGRYYADKVGGQSVDPVQYSCQQNFTILSTDGYWNESGEPPGLTGSAIGDMDSDKNTRPMYEGPTASSGSLADVAKYYYETDLRTTALVNCTGGSSIDFATGTDVCKNNVFTSSSDSNVAQHMTSFTMGLGADGTLNYQSDYETATSGDFYNIKNNLNNANWPVPANNTATAVDDLWHAAINGRGSYFSAKDPNQIITGFTKALSAITAKLGSAAAAATSTLNPVSGNNFAYVASYTTVLWKGNLEARPININTGEVSDTASWCVESIAADACPSPGVVVTDTSGSSTVSNCVVSGSTPSSCTSPGVFDSATNKCTTQISNACTGTMPSKVGATTDTRTIYTSVGGVLTPFTAANFGSDTNFSAAHINGLSQWGTLSPEQQTAAAGANLVNYLRGQNGYEDRSSNAVANRLYRTREATLGDALESQPAFIASPTFNYTYPGYAAFKATSRPGTVYMGTNDGMLHAFDGSTGVERWAYIPSLVIPDLWQLASANYSSNHVNLVNGSPVISDFFCTANCGGAGGTAGWRTMLVAGLNGGGRGYYALDITDPTAPTLLWEFNANKTPPYGDPDLGYSFGRPVVTRKDDGTWVVLVTSGYDNGSLSRNPYVANSPAGNGGGYLYVLDATTGSMLATNGKIGTGDGDSETPSGLAQIAVWNEAPTGNEGRYVYGGDLNGNVWKFDIKTGGSPLRFVKLTNQSVMTTPILGLINGSIRVVYFGTGKYLEKSDLTTKAVQSFYAVKDDGTSVGDPRSATGMVSLVMNTTGATRSVAVNPANEPNFVTGRGWYVNFPDVDSGSERQNIDGTLVAGVLVIPTIVPSSSVCSPGGYGWLNFFNYLDGSGISLKYDSSIVGVNVIYIHGDPIIETVTSANPTPNKPNIDPGFLKGSAKFRNHRTLWRELIP